MILDQTFSFLDNFSYGKLPTWRLNICWLGLKTEPLPAIKYKFSKYYGIFYEKPCFADNAIEQDTIEKIISYKCCSSQWALHYWNLQTISTSKLKASKFQIFILKYQI